MKPGAMSHPAKKLWLRLKGGDRITDIRDMTRCGIIAHKTPCGFSVHWRKVRPQWIHAGYARALIACVSANNHFFYLTKKQISDAPKRLPILREEEK